MSSNSKYLAWGITLAAVGGIWLLSRRKQNPPSLIQYDMTQDKNLPRGYRNNNPLNIRLTPTAWQGKVNNNTDGTFEQFVDMEHGYRAALVTMRTYISKYGLNTIAKIISRWAPENENNTLAYIRDVCSLADLTPDTIVNLNDQDTLTKMAYAMSIIENGNTEYTRMLGLPDMETINKAWRMI